MHELRWNPLLATYTMVAANRQKRPDLEKGDCPFCPGSGLVPDQFGVLVYNNDFPALSIDAKAPESSLRNSVYHNKTAYGKCEVILYSDNHNVTLADVDSDQIEELIDVWCNRFKVLSKDPKIKYIFPFENKGEEVGVTMHHPHGQLYAYSFVPVKVKQMLENAEQYFIDNKSNLFEDILKTETKEQKRILWEGEYFTVFIPYFTDYPFGAFIMPNRNIQNTTELSIAEKKELALALKVLLKSFDKIFDKSFPYMMCIYQNPVNIDAYNNCGDYFRFHIQFFPPLRAENKIKWLASSETGAGAAANPVCVEDSAALLRNIIKTISKDYAIQ